MADDLERRLTLAGQAVQEHQVTAQRLAQVRDRVRAQAETVASLRAACREEERDVERLEGLTLTRVLASLRGAREDRLARERAEADAARYRLREAEVRLTALREEQERASARLRELADAPARYTAVLAEKERWLHDRGDPRARQLLALADEHGRLTGELREIDEADRAAGAALAALGRVRDRLGRASDWSTYDTFFGGGVISSAMKHDRLDEAARAATEADRCLAALRTELADVGTDLTAPRLQLDGFTRFVDIWFDNIFTDLAVRDRIKRAQQEVARLEEQVHGVRERLRERAGRARHRQTELERRRRDLLTSS